MDRGQALRLLASERERERLSGARHLSQTAESHDIPTLTSALAREPVRFVRVALESALVRARGSTSERAASSPQLDHLPSDQYRRAIEETTKRLVHELAPILGKLELAASDEVADYKASGTKREVAKLKDLLQALRRLAQASEPPRMEEFNLSELVRAIADEESGRADSVSVRTAGPGTCHVIGDDGLIEMALRNGIRNAIDASTAVTDRSPATVTVSWGLGDEEAWVSVLDEGIGLSGQQDQFFAPGVSTKAEHWGYGLTIARIVAEQHEGFATLEPRKVGAKFEIRWNQSRGDSHA